MFFSFGSNDYEEDVEKWNEVDFEVIEMDDRMRNFVIEIFRNIVMEFLVEVFS